MLSVSAGNGIPSQRQYWADRATGAATAFEPTDPTQTMLATLILGHHIAVMDGETRDEIR